MLDRRLLRHGDGQVPARLQVGDGLDGEIRVDGARAETHERGEMHHLARVRRLDDEGREVALLRPCQVMVESRGGKERGDGRTLFARVAVGEDEHRVPGIDARLRGGAELLQRLLEAGDAVGRGKSHGDDAGAIAAHVEGAQLREVVVGEHGVRELHLPHVLGRLVEEVLLPADVAHERHHEVFAVGVDGRVGDLGEELFEVGIKELRPFRENGKTLVVAHRADRLLGGLHHRHDDHVDVLHRVAKHPLLGKEALAVGPYGARDLEEALQLDAVGFQPPPVRLAARHGGFHLVIVDDALLRSVDKEHLAGSQAALLEDVLRRDIEHSHLGGKNHETAACDDPPRGPQAVPVQDGADLDAVGEGNGGRTIPGLHDGRVVFVEGALVLAHVVMGAERLRHHHHQGVLQRSAARHEQLEDIVEDARIALSGLDHGSQLLDLLREQRGRHRLFPGVHLVDVAPQGVDLTVVRDDAEGLRERPGRECIGAVALMDHGEGAFEVSVK